MKRIIETRWILFNNMRQYKLRHSDLGFPATSVLKTKVQMIYNALKGGLDANTQQYRAICPSIKATFEQKYVVHLLLAIVGNAWRAFQLLGHRERVTEIPIAAGSANIHCRRNNLNKVQGCNITLLAVARASNGSRFEFLAMMPWMHSLFFGYASTAA